SKAPETAPQITAMPGVVRCACFCCHHDLTMFSCGSRSWKGFHCPRAGFLLPSARIGIMDKPALRYARASLRGESPSSLLPSIKGASVMALIPIGPDWCSLRSAGKWPSADQSTPTDHARRNGSPEPCRGREVVDTEAHHGG